MRNRILLLAFFAAITTSIAQISQGGLPLAVSSESKAVLAEKMPSAYVIPPIDVQKAWQEDGENPGQNRFAAPIATNITFDNAGAWTELPNGDRVWQCTLKSPGALGLVLLFDQFHLPAGSSFFAYTPDQKQVYGAYNELSCTPSGKFNIGILLGETAVLEYKEPAAVRGQGQIHLFRTDYAYDHAAMQDGEVASLLGYGNSLPCNINVNCTQGNNWQTEKKGVARILMVFSNGTGWCTGTLIANTAGTYDAYFLTANHCQLIGQNPDFSMWRFDFVYEAAGCANPGSEPQPKSVLGCERVSYRTQTDFMLLKMNPVPVNYDVYFNGWTRSTTPASSTTFIHHPQGDIKKISVDTSAAVIHDATINWGGIFGISPVNTHWKVIPDFGIYQPGSSGCPSFDQNHRITGQLHGGNANPNDPCIILNSYFGRFDLSWDQGTTPETRLKEWLDPSGTNALTQNGYVQPIPSGYAVSGNIQTHWGVPVPRVKVQLTGTATASTVTDTSGNYQFINVPMGGNYTISAVKDTNDINGISTFDMLLISKHVLGVQTLDSPWKIIAADANKNNSVTTTDIVELRKLILGLTTTFQSNTSWRFYPAFLSFPNPTLPFGGGALPESITITNLQADYSGANFKGVKVGDVNNSADPGQ